MLSDEYRTWTTGSRNIDATEDFEMVMVMDTFKGITFIDRVTYEQVLTMYCKKDTFEEANGGRGILIIIISRVQWREKEQREEETEGG